MRQQASLLQPELNHREPDRWSLQLFGVVTLSCGSRTVRLRHRKSQALLGYVALNPSRRATREQLAGLLWSESPEPQARASLRQALRGLRQALEGEGVPGVIVGRDDLAIEDDRIAVDVWNALGGLEEGVVDRRLLGTAHICDTLLQDFDDIDPAFRSWLLVQRQSMRERLAFALEARLAALDADTAPESAEFRLAKAVSIALINLDPTHEGACRRLMLASAIGGDMAGALRRYNRLWELLDSDYDVEPSEETQLLVASIKIGNIPAVRRKPPAADASPPSTAPDGGGAPDGERSDRRLRIMVGPFDATGVDPERRYLVGGFRHQLVSSLVRFREWSLIDGARAPIFAAAGRATYVIAASSYQAHDQLHLVLTLSNVVTGEYVWSEDVSTDLATWFSTQKLIVRRLAIALNVHLSVDRLDRTLDEPDVSLALYDRWLRGEALMAWWRGRSWTEAADICRSIITEAPNFAPAYCTVVNFINSRSHLFPGEVRTPATKAEALELARTAVKLDPTFSRTHLCAAWSYALSGNYDQAELSFEMAHELNENDPWTLIASSLGIAFCGRTELGARRADLALQLGLCIEPRHWGYRAVIRFLHGDYHGCVEAAEQSQDAIYNFAAWKAAALTHLGRHDAARAEWERFVGMVSSDWHGDQPPRHDTITSWLLQGFPIRRQADWERLRDGIPAPAPPSLATMVLPVPAGYAHSDVV